MYGIWGAIRPWVYFVMVLAAATGLALVAHWVFFAVAERMTLRRGQDIQHTVIRRARRPGRIIFLLLAIAVILPMVRLPGSTRSNLQHILGIGVIASIGWALIALSEVVSDIIVARYRTDVADNLSARRIQTQTEVIRRIVVAAIVMVTLAVALMTIPSVRHIGASVLASAGLAGLVVGLAARPTITNFIAGLQVALTQPIRIDDAVIVEGEWGQIEEIQMTYVVVRLWDLRRLIVPLTYFIEKPFQNWTRTTADLLGAAIFYVDYTVPVEELRREFLRVLHTSDLWDGKVGVLQVTDFTEQSMQIRALMSAPDAPRAFDLRCYVRENLVKFLQETYPQCLPHRREVHLSEVH